MDETNYMRTKWRCSGCGSLNSLEYDHYCWRCMEKALADDAEKLAATHGQAEQSASGEVK